MADFCAEIVIAAPRERVRELLADSSLYAQWNPLFPRIGGVIEPGRQIELEVVLPGIKPFVRRVKVLEYNAGERLHWRYSYLLPGIFSWSYSFELAEKPDGVLLFIQQSNFSGLLAPLYKLGLKKSLEAGMTELSSAVRRWGERRGISCLKC